MGQINILGNYLGKSVKIYSPIVEKYEYLLMEDNNYFLFEDDSKILLESSVIPKITNNE